MGKRKLILRNFLSPGDLVMLTAAVRDLHRNYPGQFITDVRTSCPELWEHNPHITPLRESGRGVRQIDCEYPLIDRSNEAPYHAIHGFADFLSARLQLNVRPTNFCGDIHLSAEERRWKSIVHELAGRDLPFWIVNAGGKFDFTIKWWDWRRYQQVINYFRGKILFVQVGEIGHYHPPLEDVVDLRGRTDLRQLVRLVYHAQGVLCGVTALMHLAAAVPTRPDRAPVRAAVIIAGGREPTHWEAYPHHQFLHTIGALSCCATGGCWRARTRPLGDGEDADAPESLCSDVAGELPRCMDMITADDVVRRMETYFEGGVNRFLEAGEKRAAEHAVARSLEGPRLDTTINLATVADALEQAAREARESRPPLLKGRGILLFAATAAEVREALTNCRKIRALGSQLPIECWLSTSCPGDIGRALTSAGVTALRVESKTANALPATRAEFRLHALAHSKLREVLVLEPGHFPRVAPEKIFADRNFAQAGAVFGAAHQFNARPGVWKMCGLPIPRESADASAFLIDRVRCWSAITLWRWIVDRAYFFTGYVDGEGGAAQLAFAKLSLPAPVTGRFAENFSLRERPSSPLASSARRRPKQLAR
ncbi:MAG TPA: glycosyltransferase family 9 protein [Methylomirabilota bacterium]|nr:glycosyltransferase family 9 protein [Methylomirabilota bacterium]